MLFSHKITKNIDEFNLREAARTEVSPPPPRFRPHHIPSDMSGSVPGTLGEEVEGDWHKGTPPSFEVVLTRPLFLVVSLRSSTRPMRPRSRRRWRHRGPS